MHNLHETEIVNTQKQRLYNALSRALGKNILTLLHQDDIQEIIVNPDGGVFVHDTNIGRVQMESLAKNNIFNIINTLASIHDRVVNYQQPKLEVEFPSQHPFCGERFTGLIPPIVSGPCFNIRKHARHIYTLDDYVTHKKLAHNQRNLLKKCVRSHQNILVCGGPGSGKTTFANALIHEAVSILPKQRFVLLEDLPELQCIAKNKVALQTTDTITLTGLLRSAMRLSPDRILVGEVRGAEALDMLKAWNTGCPGGFCTVHANGAEEALQRILDLAMEAGLKNPPIQLVLHTINLIIFISRDGARTGFIKNILQLTGYKDGQFQFEALA